MHPGRPSPGRVRVSVASAAIMYHPFYRQKILTTTVQGHLNRLSGINKRHDQEKQYNTPSTVTAIFALSYAGFNLSADDLRFNAVPQVAPRNSTGIPAVCLCLQGGPKNGATDS